MEDLKPVSYDTSYFLLKINFKYNRAHILKNMMCVYKNFKYYILIQKIFQILSILYYLKKYKKNYFIRIF